MFASSYSLGEVNDVCSLLLALTTMRQGLAGRVLGLATPPTYTPFYFGTTSHLYSAWGDSSLRLYHC